MSRLPNDQQRNNKQYNHTNDVDLPKLIRSLSLTILRSTSFQFKPCCMSPSYHIPSPHCRRLLFASSHNLEKGTTQQGQKTGAIMHARWGPEGQSRHNKFERGVIAILEVFCREARYVDSDMT